MKPAQLRNTLSKSGRLILNEVNGVLWVSDLYWLMKAWPDFEKVLAEYNLPFEPMVCQVAATIKRQTSAPVVDLAKLVAAVEPKRVPIFRATIAGKQFAFTNEGSAGSASVWHGDGVRVTLDLAKVAFVEHFATVEWSAQSNITKPAVGCIDGEIVALLMPIRSLLNEGDNFKIDAPPQPPAAKRRRKAA